MAVRFVGFRLTIFRGFPTLGCSRRGWGIDRRTSDDPAARRIILCNPQMLMLEKRTLGQSADSQLEKNTKALFAEESRPELSNPPPPPPPAPSAAVSGSG